MNKYFDGYIPRNAPNEAMIEKIRTEATRLLDEPLLSLPYSAFKIFFETGSRVEYEQLYMDHRKRLWHFSALAMWENDDRWISALSDTIVAICGEITWAFPAHLKGAKDYTAMLEKIDLFSAETAESLAEIYAILGDRLPITIREMIFYNVDRRVIQPYLNNNPQFPKNNWLAVCNGCVAIALIQLGLNEIFEKVKGRVIEGLDGFLDSYYDDGICMEGPIYWTYGFGYFVYAAAMIREHTKGEVDYFVREKVRKIAEFYENAFVAPTFTVPFADSGHLLYLSRGLISFLSREYGTRMISESESRGYGDDIRWRFAEMIRDFFWSGEFGEKTTSSLGMKYFPDSAWYINRREKYTLAAKGGHNNEPHNHNDLGSLVIYYDGNYVVDDLGWPEYDSNYFNERRYENICASSLGHSVPIVNEKTQLAGEERSSKIITVAENEFCLDISSGYGLSSGSIVRTISCFDDKVTVDDRSGTNASIISRIALRMKPEIEDNKVLVGGARIYSKSPVNIRVSEEIFETRYSVAVSDTGRFVTAYLVDFIPAEPSCNVELVIEL